MNTQSAIYGLKCQVPSPPRSHTRSAHTFHPSAPLVFLLLSLSPLLQSRCVTAVSGSKERHRFLVGTCSAKEDNEVHLLDFDEDRNEVNCVAVLPHVDEVWALATHPSDPSLFLSAHFHHTRDRATLWSIPEPLPPDSTPALTEVTSLPLPPAASTVRALVFNPMEGDSSSALLSLDNAGMRLWSMAGSEPTPTYQLEREEMYAACWDPHHPSLLVASAAQSLTGYDVRQSPSSAPTHSIPHAHSDLILSLDYNPNKPYHLLSSGMDRLVQIFDLRKAAAPLITLAQHTHWVWLVRYNQFHDQLLLSCGSEDVALWSVVSVSSAPLGELEVGGMEGEGGKDKLISQYKDHEDSIYSGCWSAYDAWVFCTVSYDGRVVVNQVPPAEKYKILL